MILLDTHMWIWWVTGDPRLNSGLRSTLDSTATGQLAISAFSCWEMVLLQRGGRITLPIPIDRWLHEATDHPRLRVVPVDIAVAIAVAELPPGLHRDPADQIIVATARMMNCPLLTADHLILQYPHVTFFS